MRGHQWFQGDRFKIMIFSLLGIACCYPTFLLITYLTRCRTCVLEDAVFQLNLCFSWFYHPLLPTKKTDISELILTHVTSLSHTISVLILTKYEFKIINHWLIYFLIHLNPEFGNIFIFSAVIWFCIFSFSLLTFPQYKSIKTLP